MTTETTGAEAPAAEGAQPPATVENTESTPAQQSDAESQGAASTAETTGENNGDDAAAPPKRKHWAHDRIDELTRQRREAERQADYWKQRATQKVDPDSLDYEDGMAERFTQRIRQEQADTAKETAAQLAGEAFNYRETIARDRFADYDVVTRNPNVTITPAMAEIIRDSDVGPDLAYHLGKNPMEAAQIAALPANRQAVELGKLEARITTPKALPAQPPAPVQPVNGIAAGGSRDPGTMSMAEYAAWRKANP
jgi:hypothetical protein